VSRHLRAGAAAFTFLTRLPLYGLAAHSPDDLARAAPWFPVVGLVVGLAGALAYVVAAMLWTLVLAVIISASVTVWMTGAFHEDALADAFDGFGGGWTREQVLAIMKDSRVGAYALVGMLLTLAAKVAALSAIALASGTEASSSVARALIAAHVLARWSSVPLLWRLPYVRPSADGERPSAGRPFVAGASAQDMLAATSIAGAIAAALLGGRAAGVCVVAVGVTWAASRYFTRRIGGITGDALGAANQLVELSVYLALAAHWP
jgi:adenosylcobinamide-GDP ribazoletransferase